MEPVEVEVTESEAWVIAPVGVGWGFAGVVGVLELLEPELQPGSAEAAARVAAPCRR